MKRIYSILMREVNLISGDICVKVCSKGDINFIFSKHDYLKFRSQLNPELRYFICLQEHENIALKRLKQKSISPCGIFEEIV